MTTRPPCKHSSLMDPYGCDSCEKIKELEREVKEKGELVTLKNHRIVELELEIVELKKGEPVSCGWCGAVVRKEFRHKAGCPGSPLNFPLEQRERLQAQEISDRFDAACKPKREDFDKPMTGPERRVDDITHGPQSPDDEG